MSPQVPADIDLLINAIKNKDKKNPIWDSPDFCSLFKVLVNNNRFLLGFDNGTLVKPAHALYTKKMKTKIDKNSDNQRQDAVIEAIQYYQYEELRVLMNAIVIAVTYSNYEADSLLNSLKIPRLTIDFYQKFFFNTNLVPPLIMYAWINNVREGLSEAPSYDDIKNNIAAHCYYAMAYRYGPGVLRLMLAPVIGSEKDNLSMDLLEEDGDEVMQTPLVGPDTYTKVVYLEDQEDERSLWLRTIVSDLLLIITKVQAKVMLTDDPKPLKDIEKLYKSLLNLMEAKDIIDKEKENSEKTLPLDLESRNIIRTQQELPVEILTD